MKYTFLIVDKLSKDQLTNIYQELLTYNFDFEVVYANSQEEFFVDGITIYNFDKEYSQDEYINRLAQKCSAENLVIVRKFTTVAELLKLCKNITNQNQIAIYKKQHNRFCEFFVNLFCKIIYWLFHYTLYDANLSAIAFGKSATIVLKMTSAPSALTKVNNWAGIEIVELDGGENVKFKKNIVPLLLVIIALFVVFVTTIVLWAVLPTLFSNLITKIVAVALLGLDLVVIVVLLCKLYVLANIGINQNSRANIKE